MNNLQQRIDESKKVFEQIQNILTGKQFDLDDRKTVGMGLYSTSLEYHAAVQLLCENKKYGAAVALLRPQFESYAKGLWYISCSTDTQIKNTYKGNFEIALKKSLLH